MKRIFSLAAMVLSASTLFAQSYLKVNVGYALPLGSELIGQNVESHYDEDMDEEVDRVTAIFGSYGRGITLGFAYGNMFKENEVIGYELEATYLFGHKYHSRVIYEDGDVVLKSAGRSQAFQVALP